MCKRTDRVPRHESKNDGENQQQEKGQTPQLALPLFKLLEAVRNSGSATQGRRRPPGRVRIAFLQLAHGCLDGRSKAGVCTITNIVETVLSTSNTSNRVRFLTDTSKPLNNSA